jgi:GH15 family glucan-1,4-alpha-glucosidase
MRRYEAPDDFGLPQTAFNVCAFWRVDALARIGRLEQAREGVCSSRGHALLDVQVAAGAE